MNDMRKLMETINENYYPDPMDESDPALLIANMVAPKIGDDQNPEEWIQQMIYAFDELDMEFDVSIAEQVLADYGMESHCDLDARFGESLEEEEEYIEPGENRDRQAMWAGWVGCAEWMFGENDVKDLGNEFHRWLNQSNK